MSRRAATSPRSAPPREQARAAREAAEAAGAALPAAARAQKKARLLEIIKQKSLLKGEFKLVSGAVSNYYLDMKPTMFDPEGAHLIAELVFDLIRREQVDAIGGLELGAVPIVAAVCAKSFRERGVAGFVVRKEKKDHGTQRRIDGNFSPGSSVILLEDVTTKGGSVMHAVNAVRERGARVGKIIALVDREEGAEKNLAAEGITLVALFTRSDLLG